MAIGFGTIFFSVYSSEGLLPSPVMDERGWLTYSAQIQVGSAADVASLRNLASTLTIKPALGMRNGGTVIVEAGGGVKTLTIPLPEVAEKAYNAILTSLQPTANLLHSDQWQVEAAWLLISEVP